MWKLLFFLLASAHSQYIPKAGMQHALAEQKMLERIRPLLDLYISDSLEHHKNSLLGLCAETIRDSEQKIETKMEQILRENIFTTTTAPRVCDHGWISSPDKCYYVSSEYQKTTWSTAVTRCTFMGAKLVEIQTDEEATFIMRNLPRRFGRSDLIYTGRKANDAGTWVFLSNDKMVDTSVRTWFTGEPDGGSQNCGCARASDDFLMYDCVCTGFNLNYICEIER